MPSDVSIYSMIRPPVQQEGPLDQYAKMISLKSLIGNEQLNEMQRTKLSRDMQEEEAFKGLFSGATPEQMNAPDFLQKALGASPTRGMALQKNQLDNTEKQAAIKQKQMETLSKGMSLVHDRMKTVTDEPTYQAAREYALQVLGPDMVQKAGMPPQYDPEFVKRTLLKGDEMLTPKPKAVNIGGKEVMIDMNPWTNPKVVGMQIPRTMGPGERANLEIKGAEATPGGSFGIPDIVARALGRQGGGAAPAGGVTPSQLLNGSPNALSQAPAASAPVAAQSGNPIQQAMASGATGDELLAALPKPTAEQVKAMVEGRIAPPSSFALAKPYWQGMMSLAAQYEPNFDQTLWGSRNKTRAAFAQGTEAKNLTAINTAIGHLDSFDKAAQALGNGGIPAFNAIYNKVVPQVGGTDTAGKIRTFEQAKEAVSNELMRVFRGVGASSSDTAKWAETLNASDSPQALRAAVKSAVDLLESRIGALSEQYKKGMGTDPNVDVLNMVYPKARATLDRLREGKAEAEPPASQVSAGKIGGKAAKPGGIRFLGWEEK